MAFTKVQTGKSAQSGSGTTVAATFTSNPTAGNVVPVRIQFFDGGTTIPTVSVVDENGKTYTVSGTNTGTTTMASTGIMFLAYLIVPSGAGKTPTVTFNRTISFAAIWIDEFANAGGTISLDSVNQANGTGNVTTPTITVSGANELVVAGIGSANIATTPSGSWVENDGGTQSGNTAGHILSVSANTAVSWNNTSTYAVIGASFKVTASGGGFFSRYYYDIAAGSNG